MVVFAVGLEWRRKVSAKATKGVASVRAVAGARLPLAISSRSAGRAAHTRGGRGIDAATFGALIGALIGASGPCCRSLRRRRSNREAERPMAAVLEI